MKESIEKNIFKYTEIIVFDMDGTLYQLDGENGTFKNSTLFNNVIANSIEFVMTKEGCERPLAEKLIELGLKDDIGISNTLSKRYGISRSEYFDIAWNIDPKKVIHDFGTSVATIKKLKSDGKMLILLTAAPRVWMENVITELGLVDHFERKYNGEMFETKNQIFETLVKEFGSNTILSVGDQFETDLAPAQKLGIGIFQVKRPEDLLRLQQI